MHEYNNNTVYHIRWYSLVCSEHLVGSNRNFIDCGVLRELLSTEFPQTFDWKRRATNHCPHAHISRTSISSLTSLLFLLILHRSHCGIFLEFPFANVVVVCQLLLLVCLMHTQKLVLNRGKLELAFGVRHTSVTRTRPTVHTHTSEFSSHILCRRTCTYAKALGKLSWPPFERP